MDLSNVVAMSQRYGGDEKFVLAGGGNTSFKTKDTLYVKASGHALATIDDTGFVAMDLQELLGMLEKEYPAEDDAREAAALEDMMAARLPRDRDKRPSVESLLHAIFPYAYVLHTHPALVNGLTCTKNGKAKAKELFADLPSEVLWVDLCKPGYVLGALCATEFDGYKEKHGKAPQVLLLQNHGIFVAADTVEEIDAMMESIMMALEKAVGTTLDTSEAEFPRAQVAAVAPALRMLYSPTGEAIVRFHTSKGIQQLLADEKQIERLKEPFTPDHIVYCKDSPLVLTAPEDNDTIRSDFAAYKEEKGYNPAVVILPGVGFFALGKNFKEATSAKELWVDAMTISLYSQALGGALTLPRDFTEFILAWEIEQYRRAVSLAGQRPGRMESKIVIVTGAAQGFGEGIARDLAAEGARVAVADLNMEGAQALTHELNETHGTGTALALAVDVGDETSVRTMIEDTVFHWGGLDVMVANAGIAIAGDLTEMTKEKLELVTKVNYTGYFLCTKYSTIPMKVQREFSPQYMMDVIEVNSKSGLEGSNKNFAYAGSKFGGIGLTQSFALELVEYGIKVNAVCPGNLLDGPLWSDPENGLFKQYFEAGKVPGAKSIADVRRHYESLVPLGRGCTTHDVALAILYLVEQTYETGQAFPVTGGQVMLN